MTTIFLLKHAFSQVRALAEDIQDPGTLARLDELERGPLPVLLNEQVALLKQVVDLGQELVKRESLAMLSQRPENYLQPLEQQ
jgi:hypothetical protein